MDPSLNPAQEEVVQYRAEISARDSSSELVALVSLGLEQLKRGERVEITSKEDFMALMKRER